MTKNNKTYYKIYTCKGKWEKYIVNDEQEIIPFLEKIFEEDTTYRIIKHSNDHDEGYRTIFNRLDLEDLRSEIIQEQLNKDKILEKYYDFNKGR